MVCVPGPERLHFEHFFGVPRPPRLVARAWGCSAAGASGGGGGRIGPGGAGAGASACPALWIAAETLC